MSETVRKLCKKIKLASRDSTDSIEVNLDLQEPAQKRIHLDTQTNESNDNGPQDPSTSQESVNMGDNNISESGLDEDPTNYMKFLLSLSQDEEPEEILVPETVSPELDENSLSPPEINLVPEDNKNNIVNIEKIKEILGLLHDMYPDDTEVVIHTRNQWGKVFYEKYPLDVQKSVQDCLLQDVILQWRRWNVKAGKTDRESPSCYKCYVCDKAWWSLEELRAHVKIHNACKFKLEPSHHECNIVAYEGKSTKLKNLPIDGKCLKCANTYDYHVTSKKLSDRFYYCNYCYRMFETCTALNRHKGACDSNTVVSENRKQLIFSDFPCQICNTKLLSDSELSEHLLICHSVRSDEPIVTSSKTCWICNEVYYDKEYHVCLKKVIQKGTDYECISCESKFRTRHLLNCHLKLWDGGVRCRLCNKFFMRKCMVWEHYVDHSEDFLMVYQCVVCENIKIFETKEELKDHRRNHHRGPFYSSQDKIVVAKIMLQQCIVGENAAIKVLKSEEEATASQATSDNSMTSQGQTMQEVRVSLPGTSSKDDSFSENSDIESQIPNTIAYDDIASKYNTEVSSKNDKIQIKEEQDDENEPSTRNKEVPKGEQFENSNRVVVKEEKIEINDTEHLEQNSNVDKHIRIKKEKDDENETLKINEDVPDHIENSTKIIENGHIIQDNLCDKENEKNKVHPILIEELNEFLDLKPDIVGLKEENLSDDEGYLKIVETEDAESDISKVLLAPSTFAEEVTENSEHSKVFQVSKSIFKSETVAVEKTIKEEQTDDLIVVESSDSEQEEEEVSGTSRISKQKILNIEPEAILQAGYRKRKVYRCSKCDYSAFHREYKEHINSHCKKVRVSKGIIPDLDYKCTRCDQSFPNLRKYAIHFKKHGFDPFTCPQCQTAFDTATKLAQHMNAHIKNQFLRIRVLSDNEEKNKRKMYQCKYCKKIEESKVTFSHWEGHLTLNEPEKYTQLVPFKVSGKGQHALKPNALKEAIAKLQKEGYKMSTCFLCNRSFPQSRHADSKRHIIEHLLEDAFANVGDTQMLKCQICSKPHKKPDYYKKHMRDHASMPIYQCGICNKTFSDSSNFTKHKKTHNLVLFVCDICRNKFQLKESLEKHMKMHMSTEPLPCPHCPRVFPSAAHYRKHLRSAHAHAHAHAQPRSHLCWVCSATFPTYHAKMQHLRAAHAQPRADSDDDCRLVDEDADTLIVLD